MKNMIKKVLAAVLVMAIAISVLAVMAGAVSSSGSVSAYKKEFPAAYVTSGTNQTLSTVIGDWDWGWPIPSSVPSRHNFQSCYVDGRNHRAIDIACEKGSSVIASYLGKVIKVNLNVDANGKKDTSGYGTYVMLEHTYMNKTFRSMYAHLNSATVKEGALVKAGEQVGTSGGSGYGDASYYGAHLDFSIWEGTATFTKLSKTSVDPLLNHFVAIPDQVIAYNNFTGKYTKMTATTSCCARYLDAVKWEWDNRPLRISNVGTTSLTIEWNPVSGATGHTLFVDGVNKGTPQNGRFDVTGLTAGKRHSFTVKAYNSGGYEVGSRSACYTMPGTAATSTTTTTTTTTTATTYKITFDANGGAGAPAAQNKTSGVNLTLSSTKPTKTYCDFLGWSTSKTATSATYSAGGTFTANAATTLYAVWKYRSTPFGSFDNASSPAPGQVNVRGWAIDGDNVNQSIAIHAYVGGEAGAAGANGAFGSTANLVRSDVNDVHKGVGNNHGFNYTFSSSKRGAQYVYVYAINISGTPGNNFLIDKIRVDIPYIITYNANSGTGAPAVQGKLSGTNLTLSSTKPTRANYTFLGWSTSSTATSATYSAGGTFTANADTTLYAVWQASTATPTTAAIAISEFTATKNGGTAAVASGTTADKFTYTVKTNVPATKLEFRFSGNTTVFTVTSNTSHTLAPGRPNVSSDKKTWQWIEDMMSAGNRTITVTAYDANEKSASKSITVNVTAPTIEKPDVTYKVRYSGGGWLPEVKNNNDYAGITGKAITDVAIKVSSGSVKYRVHVQGDSWLPYVTGYNTGDSADGYAGNGKAIDAIEVIYTPVSGASYKMYYKVSPVNGNYYPYQINNQVGSGYDGYAGAMGKSFDRLQMWIQ